MEINYEEIKMVPIGDIHTDTFDRYRGTAAYDEDALQELAENIANNSLLVPVLVFIDEDDDVHLVAGGRRLAAIAMINSQAEEEGESFMDEIPCLVGTGDEGEIKAAIISENLQRENPNEDAVAESVVDLMETEGWNGKMVAEHLGKSTTWVSFRKSYLEGASPELRAAVQSGDKSFHAAMTILKAGDHDAQAKKLKSVQKQESTTGKKKSVQKLQAEKATGDEGDGEEAAPKGDGGNVKRPALKKLMLSKQYVAEQIKDVRAKAKAGEESDEDEKNVIKIARLMGYLDAIRAALGEKDLALPPKPVKKAKKPAKAKKAKKAKDEDGKAAPKKASKGQAKKAKKAGKKISKKVAKESIPTPDDE